MSEFRALGLQLQVQFGRTFRQEPLHRPLTRFIEPGCIGSMAFAEEVSSPAG